MATMIERLTDYFDKLATITDSEVGITRLAFSDKDWEARAYVKNLMLDVGLSLREDAFGNIFGRLEAANPQSNAATIMIGSHLDSVPQGGNYDGVAGVLSGLEVARYFKENKVVLHNPLEIVVFSNEEGSRFGAATLGSRALIGELAQQDLDRLIDKQGITLREALLAKQLDPQEIGRPLYQDDIKAFFEIHIEQGRVLEELNCPIGIVTGIAAPTRFKLKITGRNDHSGATPMSMRQDALAGAAEIILAIENFASKEVNPPVVGTVGTLDVKTGAMNVIPGEVTLGIDIRSIDRMAKDKVIGQLKNKLESLGQERNLFCELTEIADEEPVALNETIISVLEQSAEALGETYHLMPSGAGHDAMNMAKITPTGMLFIPCEQGISHNSKEKAKVEDLARSINILIRAIENIDK